jgi:hypothetical protein
MHNESRADLPAPTPEETTFPPARFLLIKVDPDTGDCLDTRTVQVPNPEGDGARYKTAEAMEAARPLGDGLWGVVPLNDDYSAVAWYLVETAQNISRHYHD